MKKQLLLLLTFCISLAAIGQVSSTNGNFTATAPNNLSLQTQVGTTTSTRLTIVPSTGNVGIGITPNNSYKLDVNGIINSNNLFLINKTGQGDPTFTTRSAGTRFVLSPSLTASTADYAFGTSTNALWSSVNNSSSSFKWFGGSTLAATLSGTGNLTLAGSVTTPSLNVYSGAASALQIGNPSSALGGFTSLLMGTSANSNGYSYLQSIKSSGDAFGDLALNENGGNVRIGALTPNPAYKLDVAGAINATSILVGGQPINSSFSAPWLLNNGLNISGASSGFTWASSHSPEALYNYGIYNTSGGWDAPDYQQLKLNWDTGIILNPGTSYGKSYVDVQGGGLRVSSGKSLFGSSLVNETNLFQLNYSADGAYHGALIKNSSSTSNAIAELSLNNDVDALGLLFLTGSNYSAHASIRPNAMGMYTGGTGGISLLSTDPASSITFGTANENKMIIDPSGNVGIGTTSPAHKLNIVFPGSLDYSNQAFQIESTDASLYNSINLKNDAGDLSQFGLTGSAYSWGLWKPNQTFMGSGGANGLLFAAYNSAGSITFGTGGTDASFERMRIDNLGNVTIGMPTANPAYKLDVNGTINATSILVGGQPISSGASSWANIGTDINFLTGNVGIGRAPVAGNKLDVNGAVNATSYKISGTTLVSSQWATSGTNLFYNSSNNVGIGTGTASTLASAKLNVYKSAAATSVLIGSPTTTSGNFTSLALGTSADKDGFTFINSIKSAAATPVVGDLVINQNGGTLGNVGIGKTPAAGNKLDVNGTINATSVVAGGQPLLGDLPLIGAERTFGTGDANDLSFVADISNPTTSTKKINVHPGRVGMMSFTGQVDNLGLYWPANNSGFGLNSGGGVSTYVSGAKAMTVNSNSVIFGAGTALSSTGSLAEFQSTNQAIKLPTITNTAAVTSPSNGHIAYSTALNKFVAYENGAWVNMIGAGSAGVTTLSGGSTGLTPTAATAGVVTLAGTLKASNGGTGVTAVTTTPTATAFAGWDSNKNLKANNFAPSYAAVATVGATTALAVTDAYYQNFTGTASQTVKLPLTTTLSNGHQFFIKNNSTQPVTVQTSTGTPLQVMASNATLALTCINKDSDTGTASWHWVYNTNTAGSPVSQWTTSGANITYGAGNIGIGNFTTTPPAERLSIKQNATAFALTDLNITNTSYNTFKIWGNSQNVFGLGVGAETKGAFNPQLLFNGSNNSVLIPTAKLGIGTAAPSANVHLVSPSSSNPIDALKIEVSSFSTADNADKSSYFSVRDVSGNKTPFIIKGTGFVGIGTSSPDQMLTVNGQIHAKDVKVDASVPAPDYVFEKDYDLPTLDSIKAYIDKNKHLPEVPSAKEFEKDGVNLGEINMLLLKKVEELTLYLIQQQKEIDELKKKVEQK
jgi:hypothetical protein